MENDIQNNGEESKPGINKDNVNQAVNELTAEQIRMTLGCAGSCGHNCLTCQSLLNKPTNK